ncbi:MAG: hypothetical protein EBS54_10410, partial [Betaproteobacteria bacterium]|nr:hypothetical protein [Betaproteobacteria bacterium]
MNLRKVFCLLIVLAMASLHSGIAWAVEKRPKAILYIAAEPLKYPATKTVDQVDDYHGTKEAKAVLTGQIQDAQALFNLRNLIQADKLSAPDLQALRKLLAALGLDAGLGEVIAAYAMSPGFGRAADLLLVPGFDQATYQRLERYVIVLPQRSALNVNTASAELLHAYLPGLDVAAAQLLIKRREEQAFSNLDALKAKLSGADEL